MVLSKLKWAALAAVTTGFVFTSAAVLGRQESRPNLEQRKGRLWPRPIPSTSPNSPG